MYALLIVGSLLVTVGSPEPSLTDGVPDDINALDLFLPKSADFGKYSQCELPRGSGQLSGICVPTSYISVDMPFCGDVVTYATCVPPANPIWPSWNLTAKDALVESLFNKLVSDRRTQEELSLANNGSSTAYLEMRFTGNQACVDDFKKIMCYYNFPQCEYLGSMDKTSSPIVHLNILAASSSSQDLSGSVSATYPMCYEGCKDYFGQCKFPSTMVTDFCQSGSSVWPMLAADKGELSISPMETGSLSNCTGKTGEITTHVSVFTTILFVSISFAITDSIARQ